MMLVHAELLMGFKRHTKNLCFSWNFRWFCQNCLYLMGWIIHVLHSNYVIFMFSKPGNIFISYWKCSRLLCESGAFRKECLSRAHLSALYFIKSLKIKCSPGTLMILNRANNKENPQTETHHVNQKCSTRQCCISFFRLLAGDPVSMRMTACRRLQQSCISNLWVVTPAPRRTEKVGTVTDRSACFDLHCA